ncbi:methyltransferase type 12 domain-containing protein [Tieghemostelium lacteum]|uniref:Methyltransferase type 12 domain-containing protein n=1 Tax=Tieghemostelium lacteum TaxID=361077 RepID=A0A151Z4D8_TIELA|nr:methyltransferase type 12 domain-containing protein [Tieghemostelium lacteum]|eukprot:KYQ88664.1 methyltransferase type 12 domain-containing protein [Tieghemostelium lacteum]
MFPTKQRFSNIHNIYGSQLCTKESLRSKDKNTVLESLNKLNEWVKNRFQYKDIEKLGIFQALLELIDHEDIDIVRTLVLFLKNISLKETDANEIMRSLDFILRLEDLLEKYYDADILNDSSTAIECLRKCAPYSTRKVGFGTYSEETGEFQYLFEFKQLHFDLVGVGWKIWDAGIGLSKWILENEQRFQGKDVLELGSGLGITGMALGLVCKSVLVTDYSPKLMAALKDNVKINQMKYPELKKCQVQQLDWLNDNPPKPQFYEIVIGSEIIYDEKLVDALTNIIYQSLQMNGVFIGTCATVRRGINEFTQAMISKGFEVNITPFPKRFVPDTKFDTLFFECIKKA